MTGWKGEVKVLTIYKQIALAVAGVAAVFLAQSPPVLASDSAPDVVRKAWSARAATAAKKLAAPGLDKCDKGVEGAFRYPDETTSGKLRSFKLTVDIDGEEMVASYSYAGQRLDAFILDELPPGWLAELKTESKTLRIIVERSNCTFALCTNDPFISGACAEQPAR